MPQYAKAMRPEDITRLFVERSNAGDADGVAALYAQDAVLAYPPGGQTVGREAIRALWAKVLANRPHFAPEEPLPTLVNGDVALTSTAPRDGAAPAPRWSGASLTAAGSVSSTSPSSSPRRADGDGRRAVGIGHSTGGLVVTALVDERPGLVGALALIDTGHGTTPSSRTGSRGGWCSLRSSGRSCGGPAPTV